MGAEDHFEGELEDGDFPGIVNAFNDGKGRIAGFPDGFKHSFADGVHGVVDDLLVDLAAAKPEAPLFS